MTNTWRTSGEASIFKDDNDRWHGWITVGLKTNGERDRRHRTGETRKEVADKIRDLEVKRETGQFSAVTSDTVTGWLEHWLINIAARRVRPRTLESYESMVRMHISPGIGRHRLGQLQPEHLEKFYSDLLESGLSAATVLRGPPDHLPGGQGGDATRPHPPQRRHPRRPAGPTAERHRHRPRPGRGRSGPRRGRRLRNSARWTVALALGLRQSEALALQWRDTDLLNNSLSVRRTLHRVKGGGLVFEAPKTKRSERMLSLPMPLVAALHAHKAVQLGERMLAGSEWVGDDDDTGIVFAQANGSPIDKKTDYDDWCRLLERAVSATSDCTTASTPPPPCCCPRAFTRGWRRSCSGTHSCARRWTSTATSCRRWPGRPRIAWDRSCSDPRHPELFS